jgi:hypothetical protein
MEELKIFISDLLDILGLGIGGNINSYKHIKAVELFGRYTIVTKNNVVYFSKDEKPILNIVYDTNERGVIKGYEIK